MGVKNLHETARNIGWFLVLMKLPPGTASPRELGPAGMPLGTVGDVMAQISAVEPGADWAGPEWGWIRSPTWTIEVWFADEETDGTTSAVLLTLRGRGDDAVELVFRLADALRCVVCTDAGIRVLSRAEGIEEWQAI